MCAECPARLAQDLDAWFPVFLVHHQDLVYGIALRSTKRPADAEDLAQDTFIRAYRALLTYDSGRIRDLHARGWLAAIASNLGRNRARRKAPPDAALDALPEAHSMDDAPQPEAVVEQRESARRWSERLSTLPPRYRRAVELRHVSGLSYPELADALERPLGTVKSDVHRGVRMLRDTMAREDEDHRHGVTR